MDRRRQLLTVVLFGLGSGAALELASQDSAVGLTPLLAALIAGSLLAGLGVVAHQFAEWSIEYQMTSLSMLALIGFVYWSAWLTGPAMITSDLRVIAEASERQHNLIQGGAVGLLLLNGVIFLILVNRTGRLSGDS